jgi:hypothetical protein
MSRVQYSATERSSMLSLRVRVIDTYSTKLTSLMAKVNSR